MIESPPPKARKVRKARELVLAPIERSTISPDEAELLALFRQMRPDAKPTLQRFMRLHVQKWGVRPALRLVQGGAA